MKKAAKKLAPKGDKITDFFASTKSPKKPDAMQIEEEKVEEEKPNTKPSSSKDGALLPIDDFIGELYSWKPKLKHFTDTQKFKNLYSFIKKEYETKTVTKSQNFKKKP